MFRGTIFSRLAFFGILPLPFLLGSCNLNGTSPCDTAGPKARNLDVDSLVLVPFSHTIHYARNSGTETAVYRSLEFRVSGRDSSNATSDLDSNGLGLFLNGNRVNIPPISWQGGGGDACPTYSVARSVGLSGNANDTSYLVELRKDSLPVRSWDIAFRYDSIKAPIIRIDSIPEGIAIAIQVAPNTAFDGLTFSEDGYRSWGQDLMMNRSGNSISASILFKNLWGFQDSRDSSEIGQDRFQVCLSSTMGIESMTVNGKTGPLGPTYCQEVTPGENRMILAFLRAR